MLQWFHWNGDVFLLLHLLGRCRPLFSILSSALLQAFLDAADGVVGNDDVEDDLLQVRDKTEDEKRKDDLTFQEFLKNRALGKAGDEKQLLEHYFQLSEALDPSEAFLRDYVLYEGWKEGAKMPQGGLERHEIQGPDPDNEADENGLEEFDRFETAYNFR